MAGRSPDPWMPEAAGVFRDATELVRETVGRLAEAWLQFSESVRSLLSRARAFLREDAVWSAVVRDLPAEVAEAISAVDGLLGRIRPGVDRILELLRAVAGRAAPVLSLVETAISRWRGAAGAGNTAYAANLGHLGAELTGQFVVAAAEADETTAGGLSAYARNVRRLAERVDLSVRRTVDWAADLQRQLGVEQMRALLGGE